ncbi:MAG: DUF481 domain-containing protein [Bacteroidia bacterium]|nr:DUF481 domain-containing protein [Bacteroidia bacterium]
MILLLGLELSWAQDSLKLEHKLGYQINLNVSGRLLRGTFRQSVFASRAEITLNKSSWEIHHIGSYRFNNTNGVKIEDNWYQLLTLSYVTQSKKAFPLLFYLFDNNLLLQVNSRQMAGIGMGLIHDEWEQAYLRVDGGFGYESTLYNGTSFENTESINPRREKALFYARIIHRHDFLEGRFKFSNLLLFRQSLIEAPDFYILIRPQIGLKLFKQLSINFSYEFRYENVYLSSLSGINTILIAGLNYRLSNK